MPLHDLLILWKIPWICILDNLIQQIRKYMLEPEMGPHIIPNQFNRQGCNNFVCRNNPVQFCVADKQFFIPEG